MFPILSGIEHPLPLPEPRLSLDFPDNTCRSTRSIKSIDNTCVVPQPIFTCSALALTLRPWPYLELVRVSFLQNGLEHLPTMVLLLLVFRILSHPFPIHLHAAWIAPCKADNPVKTTLGLAQSAFSWHREYDAEGLYSMCIGQFPSCLLVYMPDGYVCSVEVCEKGSRRISCGLTRRIRAEIYWMACVQEETRETTGVRRVRWSCMITGILEIKCRGIGVVDGGRWMVDGE